MIDPLGNLRIDLPRYRIRKTLDDRGKNGPLPHRWQAVHSRVNSTPVRFTKVVSVKEPVFLSKAVAGYDVCRVAAVRHGEIEWFTIA